MRGYRMTGAMPGYRLPASRIDPLLAAFLGHVADNGGSVDDDRKALYADLIGGLRADDTLGVFDRIWIAAAPSLEVAQIDLIAGGKAEVVGAAPPFTVDRGWVCTAGQGMRADVALTAQNGTDLGRYQGTSACIGYWENNHAANNSVTFGGRQRGNSEFYIQTNSTQVQAGGNVGTKSAGASGLFMLTGDSGGQQVYVNGAAIPTTQPGGGVGGLARPPGLGCYLDWVDVNDTAPGVLEGNNRAAIFFWGGLLDAGQAASVYSRFNTFLTAIVAA